MIGIGAVEKKNGEWIASFKCPACKEVHSMSGGTGKEPAFTEVKLPCNPLIAGTPRAVAMTGNIFKDLDQIMDAAISPDLKIAADEGIVSKALVGETAYELASRIASPNEFDDIFSNQARFKNHLKSNKQFALGLLHALGVVCALDSLPAYLSLQDSNLITNLLMMVESAHLSPDKASTH